MIPPEISNFFHGDVGKTLLLKGEPGTGKTTLALTFIKEFCTEGNGVYLTTRVDPATLYNLSPWIKKTIPQENIVDATQSPRPAARSEYAVRPLKYTDVPEFLKSVYGHTETLKNPVVVIDSWDAITAHTGHYRPEEREKLEHNLCDFSRKMNTKIIFVAEYTEQKPLDYLVDGVLVSNSVLEEGRRYRELVITKLRGCKIKKPTYLFTLEGGLFRSFEYFRPRRGSNPKIAGHTSDLSEKFVSTGIAELDEIVGGYRKGSFNLLDIDGFHEYRWFLYPTIINFLNCGRGAVVASNEITFELLENEMLPFVKEEFRKNAALKKYESLPKSPRALFDAEEKLEPFLIIITDEGESPAGSQEFSEFIEMAKSTGHVFQYITRSEKLRDLAEGMVSTHFKIKRISGTPCVYGENPITGFYAMDADYSNGFKLKLIPIV